MKTNRIRANSLILVLGLALLAGGLMAAMAYYELEQQNYAAEVSMARMARLQHDLQLCVALRTMGEGDMSAAARHLDRLLCNDIIVLNSQLASADANDQALIRNAFARFALIRANSARMVADDSEDLRADKVEAERILERVGNRLMPVKGTVAAVP